MQAVVIHQTGDPGSGLRFAERGEHELKGVPDRWSLYAVAS